MIVVRATMERLNTSASSLSNPMTPQGSIVVTTQFDNTSNAASNASLCNVQRHDLLFRKKETQRYQRLSPLYSSKVRTFAACHSVMNKFPGTPNAAWEKDVYDKMFFVGVSNNPVDASSRRAKEAYVGAVVSGLSTIVNTGPDNIEIGDLVIWTLDNVAECHKKNVRMPMAVRPLRRHKNYLKESVERAMTKFPSLQNSNTCTAEDLMTMFEKVHHDATVTAHQRVIGQAMSSATPGKAFDILIGENRR